jgi:hypothetical protein
VPLTKPNPVLLDLRGSTRVTVLRAESDSMDEIEFHRIASRCADRFVHPLRPNSMPIAVCHTFPIAKSENPKSIAFHPGYPRFLIRFGDGLESS